MTGYLTSLRGEKHAGHSRAAKAMAEMAGVSLPPRTKMKESKWPTPGKQLHHAKQQGALPDGATFAMLIRALVDSAEDLTPFPPTPAYSKLPSPASPDAIEVRGREAARMMNHSATLSSEALAMKTPVIAALRTLDYMEFLATTPDSVLIQHGLTLRNQRGSTAGNAGSGGDKGEETYSLHFLAPRLSTFMPLLKLAANCMLLGIMITTLNPNHKY